MLKFGLNEFIRSLRRNLFVILQLTAVFVLLVLMLSVYDAQSRLSRAVMPYLDDSMLYYTPEDHYTDEELTQNLKKVEQVVHIWELNGYEQSGEEIVAEIEFMAYDEEIISYRPMLKEGTWLDEEVLRKGAVPLVVVEGSYSLGERITVETYSPTQVMEQIFEVVGILDAKTPLFGIGGFTNVGNSYLNLYDNREITYDAQNMPTYWGIVPLEFIQGISAAPVYVKGIIDFSDDITPEEMQENINQLQGKIWPADTSDMYDNSVAILFDKLSGIILAFALMTLVTMTSIICSGAVTFQYERRNYGIYFIAGNNWKKTLLLSAVNWGMVCLTAVLASLMVFAIAIHNGFTEQNVLYFTWKVVAGYLLVIAGGMATALIIPYRMLKKWQPVDILHNTMEE